MSSELHLRKSIYQANKDFDVQYEVIRYKGLTIIKGRIPIGDMLALQNQALKTLSKTAISDLHLATQLGAVAVWGEEEDCETVRQEFKTDSFMLLEELKRHCRL